MFLFARIALLKSEVLCSRDLLLCFEKRYKKILLLRADTIINLFITLCCDGAIKSLDYKVTGLFLFVCLCAQTARRRRQIEFSTSATSDAKGKDLYTALVHKHTLTL